MQTCQRYPFFAGPARRIMVATIFIMVFDHHLFRMRRRARAFYMQLQLSMADAQNAPHVHRQAATSLAPGNALKDALSLDPSSGSQAADVKDEKNPAKLSVRLDDSVQDKGRHSKKAWNSKLASESQLSTDDDGGGRQHPPSFLLDPDGGRNSTKTVLVGRDAILPCYVAYLGRRTVSWVRHKDVHILSNGPETFVRDGRIEILHGVQRGKEERKNEFFEDLYTSSEDAEEDNPAKDWSLLIRNVEPSDAGLYECQINTKPIMSRYISLKVAVPKATVLGPKELFVDRGSTINLTCVVSKSPEPPESLTWFHHNNSVSPHRLPRGGVSIITEKGPESKSYLLIRNAHPSQDSGEYRCQPSNTQGAVVTVHVIDGDQTAAMHTSKGASIHGSFLPAQDRPGIWMTSLATSYLCSMLFRAKR